MNPPTPARKEPLASGCGAVYVTFTIKPFRLEAVLTALRPFHMLSLTACEVRGYGRQKGHLELYRGSEYEISFIPKVKIELTIPVSEVEELLQAVQLSARTGRIGDGKVFVQGLDCFHGEEPPPVD